MVNNIENFCSINYLEYYKMEQKKNLLWDYEKEYHYYMQKLEKYNVAREEAQKIEMNNNLIDNARRDQNTLYPRLPHGVKWDYPKKLPPCPKYMEPPDEVNLYKYYNVEKFTTGWMLNISPDWKGVKINNKMIIFFTDVINKFYENCDRFIKMKYVLENGHGEDHLHAHIVFTLNCKKPGYMVPIKKGRILTEFRNCWNRLAKERADEWVGLVKARCALNTCLLTKEYMMKDKLDYLDEEKKPESHKNDPHNICPVSGSRGYG